LHDLGHAEHYDDDDDAVYSEIETMEIKALIATHPQTQLAHFMRQALSFC